MILDKSVFMNDLTASHKIIHCTIIAFINILLLSEELGMQSTTTAAVSIVIIAYTVLVEFTFPIYV